MQFVIDGNQRDMKLGRYILMFTMIVAQPLNVKLINNRPIVITMWVNVLYGPEFGYFLVLD